VKLGLVNSGGPFPQKRNVGETMWLDGIFVIQKLCFEFLSNCRIAFLCRLITTQNPVTNILCTYPLKAPIKGTAE